MTESKDMDVLSPLLMLPLTGKPSVGLDKILQSTLSLSPYWRSIENQVGGKVTADLERFIEALANDPPEHSEHLDETVAKESTEPADIESMVRELESKHREVDRKPVVQGTAGYAQTELVLICESQGSTGGRFHILNSTGESQQIQLIPQFDGSATASLKDRIRIEFDESSFVLGPSETRQVSIRVDLSNCPQLERGPLTLQVGAYAGGTCLSVCWVSVKVV